MSDRFLELTKKEKRLEEELSAVREELLLVMKELKENSYIQDPETLVVYKIYKPSGTFVYFRDLDYKHTQIGDKKGGVTLSKKEAEEAGFTLGKKS
jgi:hypothetical protein